MQSEITRRKLLKNAGLGAAAALSRSARQNATPAQNDLLSRPSPEQLRDVERHLATIDCGEIQAKVDLRYGSLHALTRRGDALRTNYIGNEINTPGIDPNDSRWTGDVVTTIWRLNTDWTAYNYGRHQIWGPSGDWRREVTGRSADIRRVSFDGRRLVTEYAGKSNAEGGLRASRITASFEGDGSNSLLWTVAIENTTPQLLEIGELGLPLMVNDDYAALYISARTGLINNHRFSRTPLMQKLIHEQKVLTHPFIAGHSSYVLIQRPKGDAPYLLLHTLGDTPLECSYKDPGAFNRHVSDWPGPDILALYSRATRDVRGWRKNPWVNGHRSLLLQPGESRTYQLRFAFIPSYAAIRDELARHGNLGIRVLPAMVVQENAPARVEIQSSEEIAEIEHLSDNIRIEDRRRAGDKTLLQLAFGYPGQKTLRLHYGENRWTTLAFYCVQDAETLLRARARFIVERQFFHDRADPFHRHHGFLPFDARTGSRFQDSEEVWETGCSDEAGFADPLFLAQKNVYYPSREEVAALEQYVDDCLFRYIQDPKTYKVRASLYWKVRTPSSGWGDWSRERSQATFRTYNYVHPANIYFSLYRIGKLYGLLRTRTPLEYLRMSYRTCLRWFTTGPYRLVGLMEGANSIAILKALQAEGMQAEYLRLRGLMETCNQAFVKQPYPYSSELLIDQTAHEQVYYFARFFGAAAKMRQAVRVIKALRGGDQPIWFRYGNDKRGDIACWYTESLNGAALTQAFEDTGDCEALLKGYAGIQSVLANLREDGMGFNFFISTPGIYDHQPPRTFEGGVGLWGYIEAAKSYVVHDETFGWVGYGCEVKLSGDALAVTPKDGLRKRVFFGDSRLEIEASKGEIASLHRRTAPFYLELEMSDGSGLANQAKLEIRRLAAGEYEIETAAGRRREPSQGSLRLAAPWGRIRVRKV